MKVSIVTISFNQAKYIEEAIHSVIDQDYEAIEYIVVDPGSTDGSRDIIKRYSNKIAIAVFEADQGSADGLNKGFKQATGDILGFLNSDDKLLPGALRSVMNAFIENPGVDVIHGYGYIIDQDGKLLRRVYSDPYDLKRLAHGCVTFVQPSVFFRRAAFLKVGGFNVQNKTCWDGELMLDFGIHGCRFQLLPEFLSCFRLHASGSSGMGRANPKYNIWLKDRDRLFRKAYGRDRAWCDSFGKLPVRLEKWVLNPRGLIYNAGRVLLRIR
jgi:glycosyltransferase involved in cell wall biosynthesis